MGMDMKELICLFVMAMLASGCETIQTSKSVAEGECIPQGWDMICNNRRVEFISEPPGAKIEIGTNYIGDTPVVQRWHGSYAISSYWIVKAYPTSPGQYTQTKIIQMRDLPRRVYFDMNLAPLTPSIDVNVNN